VITAEQEGTKARDRGGAGIGLVALPELIIGPPVLGRLDPFESLDHLTDVVVVTFVTTAVCPVSHAEPRPAPAGRTISMPDRIEDKARLVARWQSGLESDGQPLREGAVRRLR
jgi:hypothetical protein